MKNRVLTDILAILVLYGVYAAIIYLVSTQSTILGISPQRFRMVEFILHFKNDSWIVMAVSLMCMLAWYVLGEWGIKPYAPSGTWLLVWFFLLVVILGAAIAVAFMDPLNSTVTTYYFIGGVFFFYLGSVFFSPLNAKYVVWPARHLRG